MMFKDVMGGLWMWVEDSLIRFMFFVVIIPLTILSIVVNQINTLSVPIQRESIQQTLDQARNKSSYIETAAVTTKVANFNQELATLKYYNSFILFDLFINDCVDTVEPVR